MPGAVILTEEEKLIEFAEAVARGDTFEEPDAEEISSFRRTVDKTFNNVK